MSRRSKTYCFCFGCCFFIHPLLLVFDHQSEQTHVNAYVVVLRRKMMMNASHHSETREKMWKKLFFSDCFKINNAPCDLDVHQKEGFCFHFSRSIQLYYVHNTAKWNHMTKLSGTSMHRVKNSEYWWAFQLFYHFSQTHHILWSPIFHWNQRKKTHSKLASHWVYDQLDN